MGGQIEEEREITIYEHVVRDLEIRVRMMNARAFEQRPITNDSGFYVPGVHREPFGRHLFTVHVHDKIREAVMTKIVRLGTYRSQNS